MMRPSSSGSTTFMARSRAPRPCVPFRQDSFRRAREHDLQHRAIIGSQRIGAAARGHGEAGGVEDDVRRVGGEMRGQHIDAGAILEARDVEGLAADAAPFQRRDECVDGGRLRAFQHRRVEDNDGEWAVARGGVAIEPGPGQGLRGGVWLALAQKMAAIGEEARGILRAAQNEILPQPLHMMGSESGAGRKAGSGCASPGRTASMMPRSRQQAST